MPPKVSNDEPESDRMDVIIHVFIVRKNEGVSAQALLRSACWTLIPVAPRTQGTRTVKLSFSNVGVQ